MTLVAKTAKTIVDKEPLLTEIEQTRLRGYAMCFEEHIPGLITVGAPLRNRQTGKGLGAVSFDFSIIEHSARTVERRYAALVTELGRELSKSCSTNGTTAETVTPTRMPFRLQPIPVLRFVRKGGDTFTRKPTVT